MSPTRPSLLDRLRARASSIRFRLTMWFVAILALVLLVFSVFIYTLQARALTNETLERLESRIRQMQSWEEIEGYESDEGQIASPNILLGAETAVEGKDVLVLVEAQGRIVESSGPISPNEVNRLVEKGLNSTLNPEPFSYSLASPSAAEGNAGGQYLFIAAPIVLGEHSTGLLFLGAPLDPRGQLRRLLLTLFLGGIAMLGLASGGGYWLADRAMRPVKTITQTARQISESDLNRRLNLDTQDELGQLAQTFDQMLARLQAAFERQRQFTADASHELRTPLTIVNLEANRALASRRSVQEYRQALSLIQSENEFMSRLVNNLLTLSRMDAGQTMLNLEKVDLSDLALEVVERLAPIATRRGVRFVTGELPELFVDGDRQFLTQMITNLVDNAIKYTRGDDKQVRVETGRRGVAENAAAWVQVVDNGPGIPEEHLSRLFDRFYQLDGSRSRNPEGKGMESTAEAGTAGSGLGLSIVQWIARAHGGDVVVRSEVGHGSTFEVWLPI